MSENQTQAPAADAHKLRRRFPRWAVWSVGGALLIGGVCLAWGVANVQNRGQAPVQGYKIVNVYPHYGENADPDKRAFTQGLAFDEEGNLYEGTGKLGESTLRRIDLKTGNVLQSAPLDPRVFGEGITVVGNSIYQLTYKRGLAFVWDRKTFKPLTSFRYRGEGWGLTYDGKYLIMSDGSSKLRFLDPRTFDLKRMLRVVDGRSQVTNLNELEYVEGEIYANVWHTDRIARISPKTGKVLGWIDLTGLLKPGEVQDQESVLNGIAYNAKEKKLYVTGKYWPKLFEIRVVP